MSVRLVSSQPNNAFLLTRSRSRLQSLALVSALATVGMNGAFAATRTWDGGANDSNWNSPNNWSSNNQPGSNDSAEFASSFGGGTTTITLGGNQSVNALLISATTTTDFSLNNNTLTLEDGDITRSATSGTTTINSNVALLTAADWSVLGNLVVNGAVSGSVTLDKTNTGTLTLGGNNGYTGLTTISGGVVNIRHANALGTTAGATTVTAGALEIQGGITTAAEALTLNGTGVSTGGALRSISGNNNYAGAITLGSASRINSDLNTLTLSGGVGGNFAKTFGGSGNITVSTSAISGSGGIVKDGSGTLRLDVTNSYTGGTTVSVGTLLANATGATSSGAVSVASGATLGGTGSIAPTGSNGISVSGVLAPGDGVGSVGTLTFNMSGTTGNATMASGASFAFELGLAGTDILSVGSSDMIALTGAASADFVFNGNSINALGSGTNGFYKLFDTSFTAATWSGLTVNGTTGEITSGLTITNLAAGKTGTLLVGNGTNGGNTGDIYLSVVPEPSAALLAGLGSCLLFRRRRNPS